MRRSPDLALGSPLPLCAGLLTSHHDVYRSPFAQLLTAVRRSPDLALVGLLRCRPVSRPRTSCHVGNDKGQRTPSTAEDIVFASLVLTERHVVNLDGSKLERISLWSH